MMVSFIISTLSPKKKCVPCRITNYNSTNTDSYPQTLRPLLDVRDFYDSQNSFRSWRAGQVIQFG